MGPREHLRERAEQRLDEARQALAALPAEAPPARRAVAEVDVRRALGVLEGEIRLEEQRLEFVTGPHD